MMERTLEGQFFSFWYVTLASGSYDPRVQEAAPG